jgi:hypothetical protein
MRKAVIAAALVVAILAVWGASITAHSPRNGNSVPAPTSIDTP